MTINDRNFIKQENAAELSRQDELEYFKAAFDEACKANLAKRDFLAKMSHEMRTSINAVVGLSELSMNADGLGEETRSRLEIIYNAGTVLSRIVNEILDFSKIEAGKLELVPVEYDLPSLINDTVAQNILLIRNKPIQFTLDINGDLPMHLYGDELRIKQILNNLLSNAFKYTMEGTVELGLRCTRKADAVYLKAWVKDTGIGVRQEDKEKLFLDYAQFDVKLNRKIEGTGLGLPIVKKLVELMEGSIRVESEYGIGSVFSVEVKQSYVNDETIGEELVGRLKTYRYSGMRRKRNMGLKFVHLPHVRVLVVDDVSANLEVARGMLAPYGMRVDCVSSGQQAINVIREEKVRYNAIFMDHIMPGMDGIETVNVIRNRLGTEYARTIPIIALTANAIHGQEALFLNNGFQAFMSKPIDSTLLYSVIRKWVQGKEIENNNSETVISQPEKTTNPVFPWYVSGIDLQEAYERFDCNEENFLQILHSYSVNTRLVLKSIKEIDREKLPEYIITVHGIKGASMGICANEVGKKAAALEKAAKAGDFDFVKTNNPEFIEITGNLVSNLDDLLNKTSFAHIKLNADIVKENWKEARYISA